MSGLKKLEKVELKAKTVNSNIPKDKNIDPWTATPPTPYIVGSEASYDGDIFKSAQDNNTATPTDLSRWQYQRPMNEYALFDDYNTTISEYPDGDIELEFRDVSILSMIAFGNMWGTELSIEINTVDGTLLHEKTLQLSTYREPQDWWEYWFLFGEHTYIKNYIEPLNLLNTGMSVKIKLTARDGRSAIGFLAMGRQVAMGSCVTLHEIDAKPRHELILRNGKYEAVGGDGWKNYSFTIWYSSIDTLQFDMDQLDREDGVISVYTADDGTNPIYTVVGLYTGYKLDPNFPLSATINIYSSDST